MASLTPSAGSNSSRILSDADKKISNDLLVLQEKMDLLDSMLHPTDLAAPKLSVIHDDAVRSVVGYLDACAPRMIELVEACTSTSFGVLSEDVFGHVFACNDRLQQLLEIVDTRILTETPATTTAASAAAASASAAVESYETQRAPAQSTTNASNSVAVDAAMNEEFGDLLLGNDDPFAETLATGTGTGIGGGIGAVAGAKTTGESDEFQVPGEGQQEQQQQQHEQQQEVDPFDDFFAERTDCK